MKTQQKLTRKRTQLKEGSDELSENENKKKLMTQQHQIEKYEKIDDIMSGF